VHALHPFEQSRQGGIGPAVREAVSTGDAPAAIGPYSQAIRAGDYLFISGQIPLDPATATLVDGAIAAQTHRVLQNLGAILRAAGASFDRVVKTTVYLADMGEFAAMNEVYATYFPAPAPARATIQAARLPRDVRVEIDLIAYMK
jgi:2-iminobutanoate/2-iminopropanoate deaminase